MITTDNNEPKVGDKFRVIGNYEGKHYFSIGEEVTLINNERYSWDCMYYRSKDIGQWLNDSDVEPIKEIKSTDREIWEKTYESFYRNQFEQKCKECNSERSKRIKKQAEIINLRDRLTENLNQMYSKEQEIQELKQQIEQLKKQIR